LKSLPILCSVLLLIGCASTRIHKVDPDFSITKFDGKNVVFQNNTKVDFVSINFDVLYAKGVFGEVYPSDSVYTNEFLSKFVDSFTVASNSKNIGMLNKGDSSSEMQYDYKVTQERLDWTGRCGVDAHYAVYEKAGNRKVCEIVVSNMDKFGLGGEGRFKKAFRNLIGQNASNIKKDWKMIR
jgi:hypothetical protein